MKILDEMKITVENRKPKYVLIPKQVTSNSEQL